MDLADLLSQAAATLLIALLPLTVGAAIWKRQRRWEMRRGACLKALDVIDACASHMFGESEETRPFRQPSSISKARRAYAELAVSCQAQTVDAFLDVFDFVVQGATPGRAPRQDPKPKAGKVIHDFRVQVRQELGLGGKELARMANEAAVLGRLPGTRDET